MKGRPVRTGHAARKPTYDDRQQKPAEEEAERRLEELETAGAVDVVTDVLPSTKKPSLARRAGAYLYEHYVKAIIIGVVIALAVYLILRAMGVEPISATGV